MKRSQIDNILGVNMHQGIAVYCDKLSKKCFKNIANDKTILILDSLKDPQNVGSIIRTAHLFGIETILNTKNNSFVFPAIVPLIPSGDKIIKPLTLFLIIFSSI